MTGDRAGSSAGKPRSDALAAGRLRLRASTDLAEIVDSTLDAVVPGYADAAVVYAAEELLRGSGAAGAGSLRKDSGEVAVRRAGARFAPGVPGSAVFPTGGAVVFGPGSPYAQCVNDGKPVAFTRPDDRTLERAGPDGRALLSGYASFLAVPLTAEGTAAGLIALARDPARSPFGDGHVDDVTRLASWAGKSIASVMALERNQTIADALQRGLMAAEPARPEHLEVAGRCLPADGHIIGGDWYDIIPLPHGRTGIVVGDVMGHGAEAAAVMAQLRAAAHVLAQIDVQPAELLRHLDRLIPTLRPEPLATCLYAVIDPGEQSCTLAAAGHLPPVLALPGGSVRVLDLPSGHSLGIGLGDFGQARIKLRPGAVIAFYTDGLVETRTRSFDQGISVLRSELSSGDRDLGAARDALIRSLAERPEDDVTLILACIPD